LDEMTLVKTSHIFRPIYIKYLKLIAKYMCSED